MIFNDAVASMAVAGHKLRDAREMLRVIQNAIEEIEGPDYGGTVSEATLDDMRRIVRYQAK